ncbi:carboxymuconolactone decarboxylase family protein [Actinoplanes sp. NPDC051470]|uniref:carboxymuconolactone decarboxylase family protein n=1 Tax=unclassified Actinoplanes TaxID=2626549 RepID=UPI00343635BF
MAHIDLGDNPAPGIRGLLAYRPDTGRALMQLADTLLRSSDGLTPGERELIAAHVSKLNDCTYCELSHAAVASLHHPAVSAKLEALLRVAAATRDSGHAVTDDLVSQARAEGATDVEIHDTILIAAAFSMFNRYVDGLGTAAPTDPAAYLPGAERIHRHGYTS